MSINPNRRTGGYSVEGHISRSSYKSNVGKRGEGVYNPSQHMPKRSDLEASRLNHTILLQQTTNNTRLEKMQERLKKKVEARAASQQSANQQMRANQINAIGIGN